MFCGLLLWWRTYASRGRRVAPLCVAMLRRYAIRGQPARAIKCHCSMDSMKRKLASLGIKLSDARSRRKFERLRAFPPAGRHFMASGEQ